MSESSQKTILIVGGDPDLNRAISQALGEIEFSSISAAIMSESIFRIKNQKYACVILDLKLGEESGVPVAEFMRDQKEFPNFSTPILVMSNGFSPDTMKSLADKVQGAIVKPFDMKTLLEKVSAITGHRQIS